MDKTIVETDGYKRKTDVTIYTTLMLDSKAELAERIAYVLCSNLSVIENEKGGDIIFPKEIAEQSCNVADELYKQFEQRKWSEEIPVPKILED